MGESISQLSDAVISWWSRLIHRLIPGHSMSSAWTISWPHWPVTTITSGCISPGQPFPSGSRRCAARWGLFLGGRRAWDSPPACYGWPGACGGTIVGACSMAVIGCCNWSYWQEWQPELWWPHAEADLGEAGAVNVTGLTSAAHTTAVARAEMLWMRSARSFSAWLSQGSMFSARNFVSGSPRCSPASPVRKRQRAGWIGRELAENQNSGLGELQRAAAVICGVSKSGWIGLVWICLTTTHVLQETLAVLHK